MRSTTPAKDEWIQTFTGHAFPVFNPKPEDIRLEDIAHALSNMCRFGGHVLSFYSVAQHSVIVAQIMVEDLHYAWNCSITARALLHDAAEAYLVDVPRPIKKSLREYKAIEENVMKAVLERFGLPPCPKKDHDRIKWADNVALMTEHRDLLGPCERPWGAEFRQYPVRKEVIVPLAPKAAEFLFLKNCQRVGVR